MIVKKLSEINSDKIINFEKLELLLFKIFNIISIFFKILFIQLIFY